MISQTSHASSEENCRRTKKRKAGCGCSNTVVSYTRRMIPVVRDFPKGCGPWGRSTQCSEHVVQSESHSSSSFYDSGSEAVVPLYDNKFESLSSVKVEAKDVPQALDTTGSIDLLETSDHEDTELPRKVVSEFMPRGYTTSKRASAIRDFPSPPGNFQTAFSEDLVQSEVPDFSLCYDSEFEDLMVSFRENGLESIKSSEEETPKALDDMEQIDLLEEYEAKALSEDSELEFTSSRYDLESEDSIISTYNFSLESLGYSSEEEGIDMPKVINSEGSMDQSETSDYEDRELPRKIVSEFMPRGYAARNRASAIRDFPFPPGKFQTPFSEDLVQSEVPDSSLCYDSEFEDLMVSFRENGLESIKSAEEKTPKALDDMEQIELSKEYEAKALSEDSELEFTSSRYDLESEDSIVSMYNISLESLGYSSEEGGIDMPKVIDSKGSIDQSETSEHKATDLTEETKTKGLNHEHSDAEDPLPEGRGDSEEDCNLRESENLSGQCSSNQIPEKGPTTGETQVPKQIVIALAAPNCPWSQKKNASRSNTTRDTNRRRKRKH